MHDLRKRAIIQDEIGETKMSQTTTAEIAYCWKCNAVHAVEYVSDDNCFYCTVCRREIDNCAGCGKPFRDAKEWGDRHSSRDYLDYHSGCCPDCAAGLEDDDEDTGLDGQDADEVYE